EALAPCPRSGCGGQLIEGRKGYGCTHYKQGCGFVIWKEYAGKKISRTMLQSLLEKGHTQILSFKHSDGDYKGRITLLDHESGKLSVERTEG
ncbi:topoisomerase C-terminal repeat-containing protein, partial [Paenibacillus sp. GM2]